MPVTNEKRHGICEYHTEYQLTLPIVVYNCILFEQYIIIIQFCLCNHNIINLILDWRYKFISFNCVDWRIHPACVHFYQRNVWKPCVLATDKLFVECSVAMDEPIRSSY